MALHSNDKASLLPDAPITSLQLALSSCSGAIITSLVTTPFDVVKVRIQAQQQTARLKPCYLMDCRCLDGVTVCAISPEGNHVSLHKFRGTTDAFLTIARNEGIGSWWNGLSPTLVMAVPATVIYYTMYDRMKILLGFKSNQQNVLAPVIAGTLSRSLAVTVVCPVELVRTKLQSRQGYSYTELFNIIRSAVRQNGVLSLWRGLSPMLLRDVPFSAFYWVSYESLKLQMTSSFSPEWDPAIPFVAGSLSGAMASMLTNPLDVVKTHMQVEMGESTGHATSLGAGSLFSVMRKVVAEHGFMGLYAGLAPRTAKVAPACAIMIASYEAGKSYFGDYNLRHSH